mmetsp:Transcript_6263/g.12383  ORF Transcript_6263/g.12383 Transcript_6263/m.12383 type:complete len:132 (-) Transcript_6263:22-417(-)
MNNSRTYPSLSSLLPSNLSSLTTITIPDGVATIGDYAFYGCSSLTAISSGLHTLTKLSLSPDVWVGEACFNGCTALIPAAADKNMNVLDLLQYRWRRKPAVVERVTVLLCLDHVEEDRLPKEVWRGILEYI